MSDIRSSIAIERKGYGRGLILGLTMAETLLLLVFCLLLIAAAAISAERKHAEQAIANRDISVAELEHVRREAEDLRKENQLLVERNDKLEQTIAALPKEVIESTAIDDDWRELKLARDMVRTLSKDGLSANEALTLAPAMEVLKKQGFLKTDTSQIAERLNEVFRRAAEGENAKPHAWPPIINLSEAGGYYFAVGSAELSPDFKHQLQSDIAGRIAGYLKDYDVDIIEVIGHTDEQPLAGLPSNLDKVVSAVLANEMPISAVRPSDNAGLGLARAIAVTEVLRSDPQLAGTTVLPLSAAQLIMPGDVLSDGKQAGSVETRRRIEIRVRRRQDPVLADRPSVRP
ncbi:hypothetical protein NKI51_23380 [Mesorhizobium australicum]|uniref:hypothetical protein n=1 Tax=Mesorhizobium australicum TaxID=536018 RepID=UPI003334DD02